MHAGQVSIRIGRSDLTLLIGLVVLTILPFLITLNAPLLHDSYAQVAEASRETWRNVLLFFVHPSGKDLFFRPLGYLTYWLDFKWAGYEPFRWHLWNLTLHVANNCLIYALAMQLSLSRFSAAVAASIFAIHGSRPEVVCWTAARFDLLAAFFVLLGLIALHRFLKTRRSRWYVFMICCAVLALLSKEAAYCLPFLALGMLPFQDCTTRKDVLRAAAVLLAVCAAVFAYRSWVIGGIGGYRSATGGAAILQFSPIHAIKGLFFRQWAFLFFPLNWSTDLNVWVKASVLLMLLVMLGFLTWSEPNRKLLFAAIVLVILADLPVQHLLLMTADLAGSRVLYLPVLGLALFWGISLEGCKPSLTRTLLTVGLLSFHVIALCHNLLIWRQVAFLSQNTCRTLGADLASDPRPIVIRNLPDKWHGVFFLRNAFSQCVEINSKQDVSRVYIEQGEAQPPPVQVRSFSWNNSTETLDELSPQN